METFLLFLAPFVNFLAKSVLSGTPILFGTLGEIVNEKAGHLNLGVQGMMAIGGCAGFMVGYFTDNLLFALLAAFAGGMLASLIYAFLTVTLMANQNVTGLSLTIFGVGLANFVGKYVLNATGKGTLKLPEGIAAQLGNLSIPGLSDIPVVGPLLFSYNIYVYLGIAIAIILTIYLGHTKTGRNLRAIGENPAAADAAGIRVVRMKYIHLLLGGGICGLGGAYADMMITNGVWGSDNIGEFGWIAVALVIFAAWHPGKAVFGAFLFGALRVIRFYLASLISAFAVLFPSAEEGIANLVSLSKNIPNALYDMLPFLMTALVLVITSVRKSKERSQPASCGINYFREER